MAAAVVTTRSSALSSELAQVERALFQHQLVGLDLGEVQDVVDDDQQRVAAVADDVGEFPLLLVQLGVQEQTGHADDRVHGRADLVAHAGQEGALGLVGRVGPLLGLGQGLAGLLLLGKVKDVGAEDDGARHEDVDDEEQRGEARCAVDGKPGHALVDHAAEDGQRQECDQQRRAQPQVAEGERADQGEHGPQHHGAAGHIAAQHPLKHEGQRQADGDLEEAREAEVLGVVKDNEVDGGQHRVAQGNGRAQPIAVVGGDAAPEDAAQAHQDADID
ncbi:MAG: hypothetical protein R2854_26865 [Caldilineaceae bacterium]